MGFARKYVVSEGGARPTEPEFHSSSPPHPSLCAEPPVIRIATGPVALNHRVMRIGIDVGKTSTDAVLMAGSEIVATSRTKTSPDPSASIASAVTPLLQASHVRPVEIDAVMVGIAPLARAFEEGRGLQRLGVLRIASPALGVAAPLHDWPIDLVSSLDAGIACLSPAPRPVKDAPASFDAGELLDAVASLHRIGIRALAVSAPGAVEQRYIECEAATLARSAFSDLELSLASDFGESIGVESENAAIINAALGSLAERTLRSVEAALHRLQIGGPIFFSRNDGTVASPAHTRAFPLGTLASDAANSIRGAVHLAGVENAVVIDIGGNSTLFGVLAEGFPSVRPTMVSIRGVPLQLSLPDMLSIDIGGGSVVRQGDGGVLTIGPDSVGAALDSKARVFGGDTLTVTDLAVAAGRLHLGDVSRMREVSGRLVQQALELFHARIESGAALASRDAGELPRVLVGGGALLVARPWGGWTPRVLPAHHDVANAIGAGIAPLSEHTDRVYSYRAMSREAALAQACAEVLRRLRDAGAVDGAAKIVSVEETPLATEAGDLVRLRVRASGRPPG